MSTKGVTAVEPDDRTVHLALPEANYADAFRTGRSDALPAGRWCRELLEGGRLTGRMVMQVAWRVPLAIRLGNPFSPALVAGWRVGVDTEDHFSVRARSWMLSASLAFTTSPTDITVTTAVRYDHPAARIVWGAGLSRVHRAVLPGALRAARQRLSEDVVAG